jgi:UDP-N-acetylmuramoyl-tripeptide--D-alanyl-D-alanine ligase
MDATIFAESGIGYWLDGKVPKRIPRMWNDSRSLLPGDCFIAYVTGNGDGHNFLKEAREKGASCAIVSKPNPAIDLPQFVCNNTGTAMVDLAKFGRSKFNGQVVAVTGSFGKTTTKDTLKLLLGLNQNATFGSQNGIIGIPMTLTSLSNCENFAVVEVGVDTPGEMENLAKLVIPHLAIVTGIGKIHMPNMGSEENIAREKCKLLTSALENHGQGIFFDECLRFDDFRKIENRCIVLGNGGQGANYRISSVDGLHHVSFGLDNAHWEFTMPKLMSFGAAKDFALACVCAMKCGVNADEIRSRIAKWKPSKWRGEIIEIEHRTYFADCYNANPTAMADSLIHFDRLFPRGDRLFVIGEFRESELGSCADEGNEVLFQNLPLRHGDRVIIVGENGKKWQRKIPCEYVRTFPSTMEAATEIENFSGVVYLKGHRYYGLENLII